MYISLVIPSYNKFSRLALTLASIRNQVYPRENFEVLVINDGSEDIQYKNLKPEDFDYNLRIINQKNQGRSTARNTGVKNALGEVIIFVDDDVLLHPDFITGHSTFHIDKDNIIVHGCICELPYLKFFENPSTGKVYSEYEEKSASLSGLREYIISEQDVQEQFMGKVHDNRKISRFEKQIHKILTEPFYNPVSWFAFTGGNVSVKKKFLAQEPFDEKLGKMWGLEDIELGYRLYKKGLDFYLGANAINYHMSHYRKDSMEIHQKATEYFYNKHKCTEILLLQDYFDKKIKDIKDLVLILEEKASFKSDMQ